VKISKFNRKSNRRLRLNLQCNRIRLRLHFIFGQFNWLRLLKKFLIDYDYPMSGSHTFCMGLNPETSMAPTEEVVGDVRALDDSVKESSHFRVYGSHFKCRLLGFSLFPCFGHFCLQAAITLAWLLYFSPSLHHWRDTSRQCAQRWNSQSPECRTTFPNWDITATLVRPCVQIAPRKTGESMRVKPVRERPRGRPRPRWSHYISDLAWYCPGVETAELPEISFDREVFQVL